ncbi:MAG: glycosyltransferase family 2 protein [Cetobacterium sp.]
MKKDCTIIIPHYNSVKYLNKLLNSIPSNQNIEILVIDDRTPNLNIELIVKKENLIILSNEKGIKGAGTCRNIGLKEAKGDWIIFADSDDYFLEGSFDYLKKYYDSNYEVVIFKSKSYFIETLDEAQRHLRYNYLIDNYLKSKTDKDKELLIYKYEVPWGRMIKKSFIDKFDIEFEEIIVSNDMWFSIMVASNVKNVYIDGKEIYCITDSKESLTKIFSEEALDIRFKTALKIASFLKKNKKQKYQPNMLIHLNRARKINFNKFLSYLKKIKEADVGLFTDLNYKILSRKVKEIFN